MPISEPREVTPRLLRSWPLPEPGNSKYARGRVAVLGGAARTPGAAQLCAVAALRVGAGHLSLGVASQVATAVAVATPEAGVTALPSSEDGSILGTGLESFATALQQADALVVGPGLDSPEDTAVVVAQVIQLIGPHTSLVVDAFALGSLPSLLPLDPKLAERTVLTPNDTEAGLLLGRPLGDDLVADVGSLAQEFGTVVACHDLVAHPDGRMWRVSVGHSGLATSGSGDVLAGAVGGLLARGAEPAQAACWAKYVHAAVGERLGAQVGGIGFLAREIPDQLPVVLNELT